MIITRERIIQTELVDFNDLICPICTNLLIDPLSCTKCEKSICIYCIDKINYCLCGCPKSDFTQVSNM
jgi:hypothetical protein